MRNLILKDTKIDKDELLAMLDDYSDFYEEQTGITCTFWVENRDFSQVPTVPDADGDLKPTREYRKALETDVHKRYKDYGVDNIVMMVHEDNFLYKGVWGVAWAYNFYKYSFLLCRWDRNNVVNSFNTLFHEGLHPADTLIKKELDIEIEPLIKKMILLTGNSVDRAYVNKNGFDYDRDFIHGNLPSADYIGKSGYQPNEENLKVLKFIAPYLHRAYEVREEKHQQEFRILYAIIELLTNFLAKFTKK